MNITKHLFMINIQVLRYESLVRLISLKGIFKTTIFELENIYIFSINF